MEDKWRYLLNVLAISALEEYDLIYKDVDCKGKTVLDVGADVGTSAFFFAKKGAKRIIAVEGEEEFFRLLTKRIREKWFPEVEIYGVHLWINSPEDFEKLIIQFKPDMVKSDCEGCEKELAKIDDKIFSSVYEYYMEIHSSIRGMYLCGDPIPAPHFSTYFELLKKFRKNNFEIIYDYETSGARNFYAKKKELS